MADSEKGEQLEAKTSARNKGKGKEKERSKNSKTPRSNESSTSGKGAKIDSLESENSKDKSSELKEETNLSDKKEERKDSDVKQKKEETEDSKDDKAALKKEISEEKTVLNDGVEEKSPDKKEGHKRKGKKKKGKEKETESKGSKKEDDDDKSKMVLQANFEHDEDEYSVTLTATDLQYGLQKKADTLGNFLAKSFGAEYSKQIKTIPLLRILCTEVFGSKKSWGFKVHYFSAKDPKSGKRTLSSFQFGVIKDTKDAEELAKQWHQEIQSRVAALRPWSTEKTRKLLVVVNPVGGKGDAKKIFAKANRVFDLAGVPVEGVETIDATHARKIGLTLDPKKYFAAVTVSGDGLLNELLNGICERADAVSILNQIPLGIIPGGSGNGLAASLNHNDVYTAAYSIIAGKSHPLDLFSGNYVDKSGNPKRWFGFLSVNWAILSVIDLESENLRFLGPLRFDIKGILETLGGDNYKGRVEYLLSEDQKPPLETKLNKSPSALDTPLLNGDRSKWKVIEDDNFFLFLATNLKFIQKSDEAHSSTAELSDGCMDLILLRDVDRIDLVKAMSAFEDGTFTKCAGVTVQKVKAFSLSTDQTYVNKAPMDIDGERVDTTKLDVEVHPAVMSVFYDFGD